MKTEIIDLVSEVLECEVNEDTAKENLENWDSLNHIRIILELKEKYDIEIPAEDIDKLLSVKNIIRYISEKTGRS
jgi:acyl carrier protein